MRSWIRLRGIATVVAGALLLLACDAPGCSGRENIAPRRPVRYGEVMAELGVRFELCGRAAGAGRFELAAFELAEVRELLEDDLPTAEPPKVLNGADLRDLAKAFEMTNLSALESRVNARDRVGFKEAFAVASTACNGCHRASAHAFIEVSPDVGVSVPRLDPLGGSADAP